MDRTDTGKLSCAGSLQSTQLVFTVDSYANGIAFGQHTSKDGTERRETFRLRLKDDSSVIRLRSRYLMHKNNPLHELELHLMRLSKQGILGSSIIYLGASTDPFFPFEGKFDASMKFLELFQRYTPGQLVVQTRSPLIVIAMPVIVKLGRHAAVTVGVETSSEEAVRKFTPTLPKISERLQAARTLRRFGVEVTLQASPLLPYGDWRDDAAQFAELLVENGDYIYIAALNDGTSTGQKNLKTSPLAKALAAARKFHWLRPDTALPLMQAIEAIAPEKLKEPEREHLRTKQLDMFAA